MFKVLGRYEPSDKSLRPILTDFPNSFTLPGIFIVPILERAKMDVSTALVDKHLPHFHYENIIG